MSTSVPLMLRLIATSINAAGRAGKIIRDIMSQGELGIVEKGKNDLQTEADRSAQRCIVASLTKQFPNITIIGEEGPNNSTCEVPNDWLVTDLDPEILKKQCPEKYINVPEKDIVVWVDPLDGTSEYTQGLLDHVTVLIGIAVNGVAVGGIIHQPYYNYQIEKNPMGRTIWGLIGLGVGGFTPSCPTKDKLIVTTTRSHSDGIVQRALDALKPDEIVKVGGAGHKVMLLLEGKAHAYVFASKGCKKWDTCAPEAVLVAAGGKLTNIKGELYGYDKNVDYPNKQGVLATCKTVNHEDIVKKIPVDVLDALK